jgi:hypothetical protein
VAKRTRTLPSASSGPARPGSRPGRPGIVHTSIYLPEAVHEALRVAAFRERRKIHDIVLEGIRHSASGDGVVEGRVDSGPIATVRGIQQAGAHLASGISQCPTHLVVPLSLNEQGMGRQ